MKIVEQQVYVPADNITDMAAINLIANAAAHCYNKEPTDKVELLKKLVAREHMSPFEHANVSVVLRTDIATYKQLTRHRHCSFTIASTHFIDYDGLVVISHTDDPNDRVILNALTEMEEIYTAIHDKYGKLVSRNFLPQAQSAELTMTTNFREWFRIFDLRKGKENTPNMCKLIALIMQAMRTEYPMMMDLYNLSLTRT